jgi:hypothetical protein
MGLGSGIRDPGSGKNLFRIPDPGVKKEPDPGSATLLFGQSRSRIRIQIQVFNDQKLNLTEEKNTRIQGSKRHRIPDPDKQHWSPLTYDLTMEVFSTVKVVLRESQLSLFLLLVQCSDAVAVAQRLDMGIIRIHKLENTNQNCNEVTQIL